jgi:hypothetical protein
VTADVLCIESNRYEIEIESNQKLSATFESKIESSRNRFDLKFLICNIELITPALILALLPETQSWLEVATPRGNIRKRRPTRQAGSHTHCDESVPYACSGTARPVQFPHLKRDAGTALLTMKSGMGIRIRYQKPVAGARAFVVPAPNTGRTINHGCPVPVL